MNDPMIQMPASSLALMTGKLLKANEIIRRTLGLNLDDAIQLEVDMLRQKLATEKIDDPRFLTDTMNYLIRIKASFPIEKKTADPV